MSKVLFSFIKVLFLPSKAISVQNKIYTVINIQVRPDMAFDGKNNTLINEKRTLLIVKSFLY